MVITSYTSSQILIVNNTASAFLSLVYESAEVGI